MSDYESSQAKCPFYLDGDPKYSKGIHQIRCEGIVRDSTVNLVFKSKKAEQAHRSRFCYELTGCATCPVYQMLDQKYKD